MTYESIACTCGHPTCSAYQVRGIAPEAKFDQVQAIAVAKLLNKIDAGRNKKLKLIGLQFSLEAPKPMTREELELALDSGNLWAQMTNGNWWKLRRNGKTKTWKTQPNMFSVPAKAGLRACCRLEPGDLNNPCIKISEEKPL